MSIVNEDPASYFGRSSSAPNLAFDGQTDLELGLAERLFRWVHRPFIFQPELRR
jgi:hypothetical protein